MANPSTNIARRSITVGLVLAMLLSVAALVEVASSPPAEAAAAQRTFGDPIWWPLRAPAKSSCVRTNCTSQGSAYHGSWAMDIVGERGDPIHAAGAGIFHVGNIDPNCRTAGVEGRQGTWAWVDHGGGVVTYYGHLDTITATDGQWVRPSTRIGTMGRWGSDCLTETYYLHFEIRRGGMHNENKQPITSLQACRNGNIQQWPADLPGPWTTFDAVPLRAIVFPASGNGCIPDRFGLPSRPKRVLRRIAGPTSLRLNWDAAGPSVDEIVVSLELWSPSVGRYGNPEFTYIGAGSRSHTFSGLTKGRTYRMKVAFRNENGSSMWSGSRVAIPGAPPERPEAPRYVREYREAITFGWYKPPHNGYPVTRYQVAYRRWVNGRWGRWGYTDAPSAYLRFDDLVSGSRYQFKVRARSGIGVSEWSDSAYGRPT